MAAAVTKAMLKSRKQRVAFPGSRGVWRHLSAAAGSRSRARAREVQETLPASSRAGRHREACESSPGQWESGAP
jgi:hypothetical protein